jgi:hypothetical protein
MPDVLFHSASLHNYTEDAYVTATSWTQEYLIDHSSPSYAHIKVNIGYNKKITSSHQSAELAGRQRVRVTREA